MSKIYLGSSDLKIGRINFGANVFGWTLREKEAFVMLDAFWERGQNFIDTADTYSYWANKGEGGQSEQMIGNWQKERKNRHELVIATKVGGKTGNHGVDNSRKHILESVDQSLKRLQTDYIDLYYTHHDDEVTPIEETLMAYQDIIKAGKVRYIGVSNISPERLIESMDIADAQGLPRYIALQPHYNLIEREGYEKHYAPLAERVDLSVLPYYALASGFLTGKYRTEADLGQGERGKSVSKYLDAQGLKVLDALDQVAAKHEVTPTTVALAWLLAQPRIDAPIVSATNKTQLEHILKAPELVLDEEDLQLLTIKN